MNAQTIQALQAWAQQIKDTVVAVAPKVWSVALQVKRADAIGALITNLAEALCFLLMAVALAAVAIRLVKYMVALAPAQKNGYETDTPWNNAPPWLALMGTCVSGVCALIASCYAWSAFAAVAFDQWIWIAISNPGLAVSHDLIVKALAQ